MKNLPLAGDSVMVKKIAGKCPDFGETNKPYVGCIGEVVEIQRQYWHQVLVRYPNGLEEWFTKEQLKKAK